MWHVFNMQLSILIRTNQGWKQVDETVRDRVSADRYAGNDESDAAPLFRDEIGDHPKLENALSLYSYILIENQPTRTIYMYFCIIC